MALNKADSKILIKRSTVASATPSMGTSADYTDGTWAVDEIYAGEFYVNTTDAKLWIGIGSGFGVKEIDLAGTGIYLPLTGGIMTGNVEMATGTSITSSNGGGQLDLDAFGSADEILISTDNGAFAEAGGYFTKTGGVSIFDYTATGSVELDTNDASIGLGYGTGQITIHDTNNNLGIAINPSAIQARDTISIQKSTTVSSTNANASAAHVFINTSNSSMGIGVINSAIIAGTGNDITGSSSFIGGGINNTVTAARSAIIGGAGNTVNSAFTVILGGTGINATLSTSVYVPDLVITKNHAIPASTASTVGDTGSITWDTNYIYIKTSGGTGAGGWGRVSLDYAF